MNTSEAQPQATASRGPARRAHLLVGALLILSLLTVALASSASAHQVRLLTGSFGSASSNPADPYPLTSLGFFEGPGSVAVDRSSGDFYVTDPVNHRIEKLDSSGHFILTLGKGVNKGKIEAGGATEAEENLCEAGEECQAGSPGTTPGAFSTTQAEELFLAVDNSPGPSHGDLYVAEDSFFKSGLITKFDASGHLVATWGDMGPLGAPNGQFDGADAGGEVSGPFGAIAAIGVDGSGDLWVFVGNNGVLGGKEVFEFGQAAEFVTGWLALGFAEFRSNAIPFDEAGDLFLSEGGVIDRYAPSGEALAKVFASGLGGNTGTAIDPVSDDLYVDAESEILRFASSCRSHEDKVACEPLESFSLHSHGNRGIAFGPVDDVLYVANSEAGTVSAYAVSTVPDVVTKRPSGVSPSTATLNGTVNPDGVPLTECLFEWGETESYGAVAECEPSAAALGAGGSPVAVHAAISVQPGHTYHYRLRAANANDVNELIDRPEEGADVAFGPPVVEATFSTDVAASSATLHAEVNPRNVPVRAHLEYGLAEGAYEHTTPVVEVPAGGAAVDVSDRVTGLTPNTIYHFRAVAESVLAEGPGAVLGPDTALTTQPLSSFSLPDERGWELVSPPEKLGANFNSITVAGVIQASAEGNAIAYLASGPTEASVLGYQNKVQVLSARGPSGWSSRDIPLPNLAPSGASIGIGFEYRAFSTDLSRGLVRPSGPFDPSISAQATEQTPYLRTVLSPTGSVCTLDCYRPLFTHAEGAADVPPGIRFGTTNVSGQPCPPGNTCGPVFVGASPDLSHDVVKWSPGGLTETPGDEGGLYEWSAGAPPGESVRLISVSPNGHPLKNATAPNLGTNGAIGIADAISTDGSRVVFSEGPSGANHLYLRDNATAPQSASGACDEAGRACTIQLDLKQPGASGQGGVDPVFQAASADGSRLFFTDQQQLTPGSGAADQSPDLYECHLLEDEEGHTRCALVDITPESGGEAADVQGGVIGAAEDGSNLYFVADGVLAHNRNPLGDEAAPGGCLQSGGDPLGATCNLYRYRPGEGIAFIATLSGLDLADWDTLPQGRPARVSPNGRWLAFMSERSLTGYDNRDAAGGEAAEEVFLYHATGAGGTLVCASCNPTGARPHSVEWERIEGTHGGLGGETLVIFSDRQIAAFVPGWTPYENTKSLHQSRYLSDSGRLFFDAFDALLPSDTNGTLDVYEYEPTGGGEEPPPHDSCTAVSPGFSPASGGCLGLISSGTSPSESAFLDASESGDDVFFLTAAKLSPRDEDTALDVYDARVGGGEATPAQPVICQGDACQQPAPAPNDSTPDSLTFSGPGNESPPGKPHRAKPRKHKPARKHKRAGKHKRAHHKRGGHR